MTIWQKTLTSAVGRSYIWIDALVELLSIGEILEQLLDIGDSGVATD